MQYQGGKTRASKWLVETLRADGAQGPFWEPFCGGLGASVALAEAFGPGLHSDANAALVALYAAVADGWDPPTAVSEAEYAAAKALPDSDPRKAFCAVGCSYGGKWFGGYARAGSGPNAHRGVYAEQARNALLRDVPRISRPFVYDFLRLESAEGAGFLYCDPPYAGTTPYKGAPEFDHARFWAICRMLSALTRVYVSEYAAPEGWTCIAERGQNTGIGGGSQRAVERLFTMRTP